MFKITTCKVVNKSCETGAEELVVFTEWSDSIVKILIIRKTDDTFLVGEVFLEDFNKYAKTFDKSLEAYVEETQDILSGKNDDIEFHLKDNKFFWKRKRWSLGQIIVKSVTEVKNLAAFIQLLIEHYSKIKENAYNLEKENENLKSGNSKLNNKFKEIITLKEQIEAALYKRFALLLNTKKAKIRELKNKLEVLENNKDSVFDAVTDESETELDSKTDLVNHSSRKNKFENKRFLEKDGDTETIEKRKKSKNTEEPLKVMKDITFDQERKVNNCNLDVEPVASTSKDVSSTLNPEDDEETPDLLSDESECEVELKFEEEKVVEKKPISAIAEEDSEEEMF